MRTIDDTASTGSPVWYTFNSHDGVSHLYVRREGIGLTTLCGLSNDPGPPSQTAKHCSSCTSRLRKFYEEAIIEHEWVKETVSVTMVRPVTQHRDDTVENKVRLAVSRKMTWDMVDIASDVEPFTPEAPSE